MMIDEIEYWKLSDELSIINASLLILGLNPTNYYAIENNAKKPPGYDAVRNSLFNAVRSGRLKASIRYDIEDYEFYDMDANACIAPPPLKTQAYMKPPSKWMT